MARHADVSGSFQRPTLVDYLCVAEADQRDLTLRLFVGVLEVGTLAVSGGRAVFADLPGCVGDGALSLLLRLPNLRVVVEPWAACVTNVTASWHALVGDLVEAPGRTQRLALVREEISSLGAPAPTPPRDEVGDRRLLRVALDLIDHAAIEAYLADDIEHARDLLGKGEVFAPGDVVRAANLERLRLRQLDDEVAESVAKVAG